MRALVTGGAGFMGCHLAQELLDMGHEVYVLDDLSGGFEENVPEGADLFNIDITNHEKFAYWFDAAVPELVFHLAAYAAEGLSPFIRRHNYMNNVIGSANIINECIKHEVKFLCFTSSMAVYGDQQAPFTEDMELRPIDPYGVAKAAVERDLEIAHQQHGLNYVIFRPHNVYGPRQNLGDPYRNVVGIFMRQIKNGEPLTIYGDGTQVREFTYIDDVIPYIARSYQEKYLTGRTFNLGLGELISINALAEKVGAVAGVYAQHKYLPKRHEVHTSYPTTSTFKAKFVPYLPTNLTSGLISMWDWAKDAPVRQSKLPEIEVREGFYPYWEGLS